MMKKPNEPGAFEHILAKFVFETDYEISDVDEYWGKPAEELPMRLWVVNEDGEIENPFWDFQPGGIK
jgi:hypothetical protein